MMPSEAHLKAWRSSHVRKQVGLDQRVDDIASGGIFKRLVSESEGNQMRRLGEGDEGVEINQLLGRHRDALRDFVGPETVAD